MGCDPSGNNQSYTFAFTPSGSEIQPAKPPYSTTKSDSINRIFIYEITPELNGEEQDISFDQGETISKRYDWTINIQDLNQILTRSSDIGDGVYVYSYGDKNIVFIDVADVQIFKPELVCERLYKSELANYRNKKYILINRWSYITGQCFKNQLSDILKARTAENYITTLLITPQFTKCYQPGFTKNVQEIKPSHDGYRLDFKRMSGPEGLWKETPLWRTGYELLIKRLATHEG
jgi:hypothetical protein